MASNMQSGPNFLQQLHVGHGKVFSPLSLAKNGIFEVRKENGTGATHPLPKGVIPPHSS